MSGIIGTIGSKSGSIARTSGGESGGWTPVFRKGTTDLSVGTRYGYYYVLGDLLYISFYGYKPFSSSVTVSGRYNVGGLPYAVEGQASSAYAFIKIGYGTLNGGNFGESTAHRMQSNHDPDNKTLTLYGANHSADWNSGAFELSASGVLRLLHVLP